MEENCPSTDGPPNTIQLLVGTTLEGGTGTYLELATSRDAGAEIERLD
jgi:hypothetical protein